MWHRPALFHQQVMCYNHAALAVAPAAPARVTAGVRCDVGHARSPVWLRPHCAAAVRDRRGPKVGTSCTRPAPAELPSPTPPQPWPRPVPTVPKTSQDARGIPAPREVWSPNPLRVPLAGKASGRGSPCIHRRHAEVAPRPHRRLFPRFTYMCVQCAQSSASLMPSFVPGWSARLPSPSLGFPHRVVEPRLPSPSSAHSPARSCASRSRQCQLDAHVRVRRIDPRPGSRRI